MAEQEWKKGTAHQIPQDGNNLKVYLEHQIREYREESESLKALYADLQEHIEECKAQIRSLKSKEDVGYSILSPISVDSAYQSRIERTKSQKEAFEKQKDKYLNDIRFYDGKIEEMQSQLEAYEQAEQQKPEEKTSEKPLLQSQSAVTQTAEISAAVQSGVSKEQCEYILHKLSEIKGYLKVDRMRSRLEIEQLENYVNQLMKNT